MSKKSVGFGGIMESFFQRFVPNEVPGNQGRFGYDPSNPIPVAGIQGEYLYLSRLKMESGERLYYRHNGSCYAANSANEIDRFTLTNSVGTTVCELYMDKLHVGNSQKVPQGLLLD
ncbi:MAG: hypothetical protein ABFC31_14020 [Clostridiaceae bacterium]